MAKKKFPKIVTPVAVAGFSHLLKPDSEGKYADDKYKITVFIPKTEDLTYIEDACREAAKMEWGKVPAQLGMPIRDGDEKVDDDGKVKDGYEGNWYLTIKSKYVPAMVDAARNELPDGVAPYGGDIVKVSANTFPYVSNGKKAVTLQLRGVQLLEKRQAGSSDDFEDESDEFDAVTAKAAAAANETADDADDDDDF